MDRRSLLRILVVLLAGAIAVSCASAAAPAASTADQLKALTKDLDDAVAKLKANDVAGAKAAFEKFDKGWEKVEDAVKAKNKDGYAKIEDGITDVKAALMVPATVDTKKAIDALQKLDSTVEDVVPTLK